MSHHSKDCKPTLLSQFNLYVAGLFWVLLLILDVSPVTRAAFSREVPRQEGAGEVTLTGRASGGGEMDAPLANARCQLEGNEVETDMEGRFSLPVPVNMQGFAYCYLPNLPRLNLPFDHF